MLKKEIEIMEDKTRVSPSKQKTKKTRENVGYTIFKDIKLIILKNFKMKVAKMGTKMKSY